MNEVGIEFETEHTSATVGRTRRRLVSVRFPPEDIAKLEEHLMKKKATKKKAKKKRTKKKAAKKKAPKKKTAKKRSAR